MFRALSRARPARAYEAGSFPKKTAIVIAGGGSLGAVQVGMLRELTRRGVSALLE
jgi:predicted acylesterase/phospholipase RssA